MRNSEKEFEICIDNIDNECVTYAAYNLQSYLEKITGFLFPLKITNSGEKDNLYISFCRNFSFKKINEINIDKIESDGFILFGDEDGLIIKSKTDRGVIYGVFDYLERSYNARFLTNDFEHIEKRDELVFPKGEILSNPSFQMRGYFIGDTYKDLSRCGDVDLDFVLKNKNKDIFMQIPKKYGGAHKVYGRNNVHNFHYFVPFEVYGNEHPSWYRFFYVNKRITPTIDITNGIKEDGTLDESMDISVAKVVIKEMIKDVEAHPDKEIFNFTQEDGEYFYESEKANLLAQKYKRSGILVRFCNVVINEVNKYIYKKYKRKVKLVTFAYSYAKEAPIVWKNNKCYPIDETVKPNEDVIIQLALFANGAYGYFDENQDEDIRKVMTEWKVVAKNFWFWMYDIDFHKYLYYYDSFDQIGDNVRGFKDYGISYLAVNGPLEEGRSWQCNIRAYAYRKLMWDVTLDENKLMEEYIDLYYGIASSNVKEVIRIFHENSNRCRKDKEYRFCTFGSSEKAKYNPKDMLIKIYNIILDGEKKIINSDIENKEVYLEHILGVKATPLLMLYDMYFEHNKDGDLNEYLALKDELFKTIRRAKIHMAGEHWNMDQFENECDELDRKNGRI